jgi:hypothetical protein
MQINSIAHAELNARVMIDSRLNSKFQTALGRPGGEITRCKGERGRLAVRNEGGQADQDVAKQEFLNCDLLKT